MTAGGAEKSQQCHKYFLQYSTFTSERPQFRTWGRQTCFLPRAPSNLVTPLLTRSSWNKFVSAIHAPTAFRMVFYTLLLFLRSTLLLNRNKHIQRRTQKIFMGGFIQWHMIVICIWCALFVTSQFYVMFTFPHQRFGEVCWHNMHIFLHAFPLFYMSVYWI